MQRRAEPRAYSGGYAGAVGQIGGKRSVVAKRGDEGWGWSCVACHTSHITRHAGATFDAEEREHEQRFDAGAQGVQVAR